MKHLKRLTLIAILGLLAACSSNKIVLEPITQCNFPDSPNTKAPLWICGDEIEGLKIFGVGSTQYSKAGVNFMLQQASANARVLIAQQLKADVESAVKNYTEQKGSGSTESIDEISSVLVNQVTNLSVGGAKIIRKISSPNGTFYVLVGINEEDYNQIMKTALDNAYTKDTKLFQNNNLTKEDLSNLSDSLTAKNLNTAK